MSYLLPFSSENVLFLLLSKFGKNLLHRVTEHLCVRSVFLFVVARIGVYPNILFFFQFFHQFSFQMRGFRSIAVAKS